MKRYVYCFSRYTYHLSGCSSVGRVRGLGPRGRRFEPGHPDQFFKYDILNLMPIKNLKVFAISLLSPFLFAFIGQVFTTPSISTWYATLNKPSFSPPNWLFGPVWTILYFLMGISLYLIWSKSKKNFLLVKLFYLHLAINTLWSILFFRLKNPTLAFIDIIALFAFIVFFVYKFYPLNKTASYLLLPYLLWVSFASILNLSIVLLN